MLCSRSSVSPELPILDDHARRHLGQLGSRLLHLQIVRGFAGATRSCCEPGDGDVARLDEVLVGLFGLLQLRAILAELSADGLKPERVLARGVLVSGAEVAPSSSRAGPVRRTRACGPASSAARRARRATASPWLYCAICSRRFSFSSSSRASGFRRSRPDTNKPRKPRNRLASRCNIELPPQRPVLRCQPTSRLEMTAASGGSHDVVRSTRKSGPRVLHERAVGRLDRHRRVAGPKPCVSDCF